MSVLTSQRHQARPQSVRTRDLPWLPGMRRGLMRRELERAAGFAPRSATSIVRFEAGVGLIRHLHYVGEEIFVLGGVFSDESGDFGPGTYLRNPAGSSHGPYSAKGCVIFIKLLPDDLAGGPHTIIDTSSGDGLADWHPGVTGRVLHAGEQATVSYERLSPGAQFPAHAAQGVEEFLLVSGEARSALLGDIEPMDWIVAAPGENLDISSATGATFWVKRGHARDIGNTHQPRTKDTA